MNVAILLTTYNSEKYLKEQLNSLFNQSFTQWKLYIRDDGSSDNTLGIIHEYKISHPHQIVILQDKKGNLGAANSFMTLLDAISANYYLFCDHDDIWLSKKIESEICRIKELENQHPNTPIVVFTDLCVVDQNLKVIAPSLWKYSHINPNYCKDVYLLSVSSTLTGCTMIMNEQVKNYVLPYPKEAMMHDWWISLNIAHYGIIDYIPEATILYRQHGKNTVGAEKVGLKHYLERLQRITHTIKENRKVILMLKKLHFNLNHFKRMRIKIGIIIQKTK